QMNAAQAEVSFRRDNRMNRMNPTSGASCDPVQAPLRLIRAYLRLSAASLLFLAPAFAAELESRQLTHYVPQDALEAAVRKEGWSEVALAVKGGIRKGDVVRIWAGGSIDRGNGEQPGANVNGPVGIDAAALGKEKPAFALSSEP